MRQLICWNKFTFCCKNTTAKTTATESGNASPKRQQEQHASLENLLAEVSKMSKTSDVSTIKETPAELKNTVNAMEEQLTQGEGRISDMEGII